MIGIQVVSARIGRVTGRGLAANIRRHYPAWLLYLIVGLLLVANTINIAADLGAMAAASKLLVGGRTELYIVGFAALSLGLQIFIPFRRYAPLLKILTLALFSYVATVFVVEVPWSEVALRTLVPRVSNQAQYLLMLVPSSHDDQPVPVLLAGFAGGGGLAPRPARGAALRRTGCRAASPHQVGHLWNDFSNLASSCSRRVTLNAHGITDIRLRASRRSCG
jgi:hypothetical protein